MKYYLITLYFIMKVKIKKKAMKIIFLEKINGQNSPQQAALALKKKV